MRGTALLSRTVLPAAVASLAVALLAAGVAGQQPANIILPRTLIAGQPATLAVLDAAGALVPGAEVDVGGERIKTDLTGRATFTVPALPEDKSSGLLMAEFPGGHARATAVVNARASAEPEGVHLGDVPRMAALTDRFSVTGAGFGGEAAAVEARLGDAPAMVLAASPVVLVLLPSPKLAPGAARLEVRVGPSRAEPATILLVAFELASEKPHLAPREKCKFTVRVRGTEQPVEIELRNLTPDTVKLAEDDSVVRVRSTGGADNKAQVVLEGRRAGDFSLSARLIPQAAGLPDIEAARQKLLSARKVAQPGWGARLDRLIERLEKNPQEAAKVRNELEKLLALRPPGELAQLIEAAWLILLGP
jgi:hypothetical protein